MKATGFDIKAFYHQGWPDDHYQDGSEIDFHAEHGTWLLKPEVEYDLEKCGMLVPEDGGDVLLFEEAYTAWLAANFVRENTRSIVTLTVGTESDILLLRTLAAEHGWTITVRGDQ